MIDHVRQRLRIGRAGDRFQRGSVNPATERIAARFAAISDHELRTPGAKLHRERIGKLTKVSVVGCSAAARAYGARSGECGRECQAIDFFGIARDTG